MPVVERLRELIMTKSCEVCETPRGLYALNDSWPPDRMGGHRHPRWADCTYYDCPCAIRGQESGS